MVSITSQLDFLTSLGILGSLFWFLGLWRLRKSKVSPLVIGLILFSFFQAFSFFFLLLDLWVPDLFLLEPLYSLSLFVPGLVFLSALSFADQSKTIRHFLFSLWPLLGFVCFFIPFWVSVIVFSLGYYIGFFRPNRFAQGKIELGCSLRLRCLTLFFPISASLRIFLGFHHIIPMAVDIFILFSGLVQAWNVISENRPVSKKASFSEKFLSGKLTPFIFITLVFVVWGLTEGLASLSIRRLETQMLETIKLASIVLPRDLVIKLTGSPLDAGTTDYIELTSELRRVRDGIPLIRRLYILKRILGKVRVFADSEPAWSSGYIKPGTEIDNTLVQREEAFKFGSSGIMGLTTKNSSDWLSVLTPYRPYDHLTLVLGMDIFRGDWEQEIRLARIFPLSLGFLLLFITAAFTYLIRESWMDRKRYEESEWHLRMATESAELTLWSWPPKPDGPGNTSPLGMPSSIGAWLRSIPLPYRKNAAKVFRDHTKGLRPDFEALFPVESPEGKIRWIFDRGRILERSPDGKPSRMAGTRLDITERRQVTERDRETERRLLAAQKWESLGLLAGGVAHDFNNLLAAVLGNIEMAEMELLQEPHQAIQYLQVATKAVFKASDLTRQMLAFAGRNKFRHEILDFNHILNDNFDLLRSSLRKNIILLRELEEVPLFEGDPSQIQQIVMNLVLNAGEALGTQPGEILLATRVQFFSLAELEENLVQDYPRPGLFLTLRVKDNGPGIDLDIQKKLFEPFFSTRFNGRGLGLAAVHGIVQSYNGIIFLHSFPGNGADFLVGFPLSSERQATQEDFHT